ncbi:acyl-CoA dehydrogenase family protein [Epidermidibacterium keratini]
MLANTCPPEEVVAAESHGWNERVWKTLREGGFHTIALPESAGGSGGTLTDACVVLQELGRASGSVPYAEHALVGGWLLTASGRDVPEDVAVVGCEAPDAIIVDETVNGVATRVPYGRAAEWIIVLAPEGDGARAALVPASATTIEPGRNLADEARDTIHFDAVPATETWDVDADALEQARLRTAFARSALIAGALERVLQLSVRYTGEREQFGRPIARFQAVQRHLVKIAEHAHLAKMAVDAAAFGDRDDLDRSSTAVAKIVASQSASAASGHAHQAHGAIGMTKEYELGQLSRRLWSWRDEGGTAQHWSRSLGALVAGAGKDEVWPLVSAGTALTSPPRDSADVA